MAANVTLSNNNELTNKIDDKPWEEKIVNVPNDADDNQTITDEDCKGASQHIKQHMTLLCLIAHVCLYPKK